MCVESKIGEVITAECTCPVNCSNVHHPVCSVYHVEFPNICELHKFACANEMHIQVKHQGNCSEQGTQRLNSWIMCTIGGLGRHIGRQSVDISVDYRSTIGRLSVDNRPTIGR